MGDSVVRVGRCPPAMCQVDANVDKDCVAERVRKQLLGRVINFPVHLVELGQCQQRDDSRGTSATS